MSETEAEIMQNKRRVVVNWLGEYKTAINIRNAHHLKGDEPPAFGGDDSGPMPTELLLAGVASCMALSVSHVAEKMRLNLAELEVNAWGEKDPEAFRFSKINVHVSADLPPAKLARSVKLAIKECFVGNTIGSGCEIVYTHESIQ